MPGLEIPVELGAEFIHGGPEITLALLREAGIPAVESTREQRYLEGGRLRSIDAFAHARQAVQQVSVLERDVSFQTFLARRRLPQKTRSFARMMVQGFDAADPKRVSARSIAQEWGEAGALGASQPRPLGGYGALLDWLAHSAVKKGACLQLESTVRELRWKRGAVIVRGSFLGQAFVAKAARAIVALPLGVLQSGAVHFAPPLQEKRPALKKLAVGPVIRVALCFQSAFWERHRKQRGSPRRQSMFLCAKRSPAYRRCSKTPQASPRPMCRTGSRIRIRAAATAICWSAARVPVNGSPSR